MRREKNETMMTFKDTTFCRGGTPRCAAFYGCPYALTDEVVAAAEKWCNPSGDAAEEELMELVGPPIAFYTTPLELACYEKPEGK
jgi:hypothetical protein